MKARYALNQKYRENDENKILEITGEEILRDRIPYARVIFHDTGPGIPASIMDKLKTPFFTAKPDSKGTGLGLSISHGIVADHSGRLDIQSREGEFTRIIIDLPAVFIETNIRRVFIHFFFRDKKAVADQDILPLIERTLDRNDPRHWYYALMDYGFALGNLKENPNRKSTHYTKQSPFRGSRRQMRADILRLISDRRDTPVKELAAQVHLSYDTVRHIIDELCGEGFIKKKGHRVRMG